MEDHTEKYDEQALQLLTARELILDGEPIETALIAAPDVDEQLIRALGRLLTGGDD